MKKAEMNLGLPCDFVYLSSHNSKKLNESSLFLFSLVCEKAQLEEFAYAWQLSKTTISFIPLCIYSNTHNLSMRFLAIKWKKINFRDQIGKFYIFKRQFCFVLRWGLFFLECEGSFYFVLNVRYQINIFWSVSDHFHHFSIWKIQLRIWKRV